MGPPDNCPACPCAKTALWKNIVIDISLSYIYIYIYTVFFCLVYRDLHFIPTFFCILSVASYRFKSKRN